MLLSATEVLGIQTNRVDEALEACGLTYGESKRRIRTYSLGMRQRLSLALAILPNPDVLILDEPVNGLDPEGIHWMRYFLGSFAQKGGAVLLSSHLLAEMEKIADHVVMVGRGKLIGSVDIQDLVNKGQSLEELYLAQTAAVSRVGKVAHDD